MKRILALVALAFFVCTALGQDPSALLRTPVSTATSVAYTGTAGNTSAYGPGPGTVYVFCTTDCYVAVGEGVTATTSDTPIPAYTPIWLPVPRGTGAPWRVSAVQISSSGTVYVRPFN